MSNKISKSENPPTDTLYISYSISIVHPMTCHMRDLFCGTYKCYFLDQSELWIYNTFKQMSSNSDISSCSKNNKSGLTFQRNVLPPFSESMNFVMVDAEVIQGSIFIIKEYFKDWPIGNIERERNNQSSIVGESYNPPSTTRSSKILQTSCIIAYTKRVQQTCIHLSQKQLWRQHVCPKRKNKTCHSKLC